MVQEWVIADEIRWNMMRDELQFTVINNGKYYPCSISQIALNDYFRTEDTKEAAIKNFGEHKEKVLELAVELIEKGLNREDDGFHFINSKLCNARWS